MIHDSSAMTQQSLRNVVAVGHIPGYPVVSGKVCQLIADGRGFAPAIARFPPT